jgi:hypothetical protein
MREIGTETTRQSSRRGVKWGGREKDRGREREKEGGESVWEAGVGGLHPPAKSNVPCSIESTEWLSLLA